MSFDENDDDAELPQLNNDSRRREGGHNVAPGLPENRFADSQTEMPGFPEAFK